MKAILMVFSALALSLSPFDVYATRCDITTTPVNFGSYDIFSSFPLDSTGTVSVSCHTSAHKTIPIEVTIGRGFSGGFHPRRMQGTTGGDRMNYDLFINASRTQRWGDGSSGTTFFQGSVHRNTPLNLTVYGRVPARQNLRAGSYSDSLVVTVSW